MSIIMINNVNSFPAFELYWSNIDQNFKQNTH